VPRSVFGYSVRKPLPLFEIQPCKGDFALGFDREWYVDVVLLSIFDHAGLFHFDVLANASFSKSSGTI
jgi:hypothetical protein